MYTATACIDIHVSLLQSGLLQVMLAEVFWVLIVVMYREYTTECTSA